MRCFNRSYKGNDCFVTDAAANSYQHNDIFKRHWGMGKKYPPRESGGEQTLKG
jgi:hypothetical protein